MYSKREFGGTGRGGDDQLDKRSFFTLMYIFGAKVDGRINTI